MAITYNAFITATYIYREMYDGVGGKTYGANDAGVAGRDYFLDTPRVNDALYFTTYIYNSFRGGGLWQDIKVNVATARTNAGAGVWEYYNGSTWATLTVTDPTNGFTVTGSKTITFTPPTDWRDCQINSSRWAYYVRYRLTDVTGITQGGNQGLGFVQMHDRTILLTGYSAGTPGTFHDIYNADVAGGWGVVTRAGGASSKCPVFTLKCNLKIGDGSTATWFLGRNVTAQIGGNLLVAANAGFQLGDPSPDGKSSKNGCTIMLTDPDTDRDYGYGLHIANSTVKLYNSSLITFSESQFGNASGTFIMKDFDGSAPSIVGSVTVDGVLMTFGGGWAWGFRIGGALVSPTLNGIKVVQSGGFGIGLTYLPDNTILEVKNAELHDCSSSYIFQASGTATGWNIFFRDCTGFNINNGQSGGTVVTCTAFECYSVELTVVGPEGLPISNALCRVLDPGLAPYISEYTDISGKQNLRVIANKALHNGGTITRTVCNPNTIVISAPGYETVSIPLTITEKKVMQVCLHRSTFPGPMEMGMVWR